VDTPSFFRRKVQPGQDLTRLRGCKAGRLRSPRIVLLESDDVVEIGGRQQHETIRRLVELLGDPRRQPPYTAAVAEIVRTILLRLQAQHGLELQPPFGEQKRAPMPP
jgi:hypothetical protein